MTEKEWDELAERMARQLYDGKANGELHPETVRETAKTLFEAITQGYGTELPPDEINGNSAKYEPLRLLYKNTFHFSAAKNWNQMREINALLRDGKGGIRPFEDFKKDVLKINATYNQAYLQAEYQHALTASDSMAKWEKIQREKAILPFLEYTAVNDDRTRADHAALNGTIKHADDPFWNVYYPPNGWRCRCKVRQRATGPEREPGKLTPLDKMFQSNAGKEGVVFNDKHPYYKTIPAKAKKNVLIVSDKMADRTGKRTYNEYILSLPKKEQLIEVYDSGSGKVQKHSLVKREDDYFAIEQAARIAADTGKEVQILPALPDYKRGRQLFFKEAKPKKSPDMLIDGILWELKRSNSKQLVKRIGEAAEQCNNVVIVLKENISWRKLKRRIAANYKDAKSPRPKKLIIVYDGKIMGEFDSNGMPKKTQAGF